MNEPGNTPLDPTPEQGRLSGLLTIFAAPLLLALMVPLKVPAALDGFLYDLLGRIQPQQRIAETQVISVVLDEETPAHVLLEALRQHQPARIAFLFLPQEVSFAKSAGRGDDLLMGRALTASPDGELHVQALPAQLSHLPWAVLGHAALLNYSPRYQLTGYPLGTQTLTSLEFQLAHPLERAYEVQAFRINFPRKGQYLPTIPAEDILQGAFPQGFFKEKTLLISRAPRPEFAAFDHLRIAQGRVITRAQYHASATETLLGGQFIRETPRAIAWPVLLLYALLLGVFYQRAQNTFAFRMTLVLLCFPLGLAWLGLLFHLWIFAADMMLLNLILYFLMVLRKNLVLAATLNRQIMDTSNFMQSHYMPKSFYASEQHWSQVANMVKQMLHLRRTIFLDRVVGDHRCREVVAINCSLNDIYEMRRDYQRTPYTYALEANGPIQLQRTYLRDQPDNEVQFLIPLVFAGEVNGFWAIGIEQEHLGEKAAFMNTLKETAVEIAEMLHHRQRYLQAIRPKGLIPSLLTFNIDREMAQLLRESTALMERHLVRLDSILHGQRTCILIYDIFGQVLVINDGMAEALKAVGFAPYDNTLADLLQLLGGYSDIHAKHLVLSILRHDQEFSFPLNLKNDRTFYLVLRPLRTTQNEFGVSPFSKLGVLCEMVDITDLRRLSEMKENIIRQTTMIMRNNIMGLTIANDLIAAEKTPQEDKLRMMALAREKLNQLENQLEQGQKYLSEFAYKLNGPFFPVAFGPLLQSALDSAQPLCLERAVLLDVHKPALMNFVLASPNHLTRLLADLLEILVNDAEKDSTIDIHISEENQHLHLFFKNKGYGIPEKQLAKILTENQVSDLPSGLERKYFFRLIEAWGGEFTLTSGLGKGSECQIKLKVFG